MVRENIRSSKLMTQSIKSLKTLKPWLEDRYEEAFTFNIDSELDDLYRELDPDSIYKYYPL